jgi:hypothetical protein
MTTAAPITKIRVDASDWLGELPHNWNYIGYDEINYTYAPEGEELLAKFMAIRRSLTTSGPIICCVPATATAFTNGVRPMLILKMKKATPSTIGPLSI